MITKKIENATIAITKTTATKKNTINKKEEENERRKKSGIESTNKNNTHVAI